MERVRLRAQRGALLIAAVAASLACGQSVDQASPTSTTTEKSSDGSTGCWIDVHGDCHGWVAADTWFADDGNGASSNAGVCLHRARDYATWCGLGNPLDIVYAAYNWNGVTVMAQSFKPGFDFGNVDPAVVTYGYNWAPLTTSPTETTVVGAADPSTSRYPNVWMLQ